ncbi:hypothetical protein RJ641_013498 [Dillenia turbinata]|uniref:Uncharacterized protein n=1 Tax=Dillenia turbinata TaxID=194707 RepID=A0AAN8W4D3_9MAGN
MSNPLPSLSLFPPSRIQPNHDSESHVLSSAHLFAFISSKPLDESLISLRSSLSLEISNDFFVFVIVIESENLVNDSRDWSRNRNGVIWRGHVQEGEGDEFDDDRGEEDRSLDLLVRFIQSLFRKVSKRARKAVRSVLPLLVSAKLISSVSMRCEHGWYQNSGLHCWKCSTCKHFANLCNLIGVTYLQKNRNQVNGFGNELRAWTGVRPAT